MAESAWAQELTFAADVAREAGALLREHLGRVHQVRFKSSAVDPVTEADQASETLISERILARFPVDRILGEEGSGADRNLDSTRLWIVDPLDGTVNFMHGYPVFAVSIALQVAGETHIGVIFDPTRDELFAAERGVGAALNGHPIHVSQTQELLQAMLTTGFAYDLHERMEALPLFSRFVERTQAVRRDGSAALNVAYVACGRFDGYWEQPIAPWDVAAGALLLREAGGTLSTYAGQQFDPFKRQIVASNGILHPAMLEVIAAS